MDKIQWYWHIHHDQLVGPSPNIEERIEYIKQHKPTWEIETRLRLLKLVKGQLPQPLLKAWKACDKAWGAYDKAWRAYDKAWGAYDKAREAYNKAWGAYDKAREAYNKAWRAYDKAAELCKSEIATIHAQECPNCPWNGETIFP